MSLNVIAVVVAVFHPVALKMYHATPLGLKFCTPLHTTPLRSHSIWSSQLNSFSIICKCPTADASMHKLVLFFGLPVLSASTHLLNMQHAIVCHHFCGVPWRRLCAKMRWIWTVTGDWHRETCKQQTQHTNYAYKCFLRQPLFPSTVPCKCCMVVHSGRNFKEWRIFITFL